MARSTKRPMITLESSESSHVYHTHKNKSNTPERLTMRKYDPTLRKHVTYKEKK
ncbi:MAG: 50S ribosomal protein L33 [Candidatus Omnitrophica bacterium CG11_big_fil_rev_8_21_14_0_20_64_10]|nr:MAG: 50S ribosomal protein L33 [Candidatus Omnitrophica bacterium CG11_big_fil_rev_8_21_14_0_20_64_10]